MAECHVYLAINLHGPSRGEGSPISSVLFTFYLDEIIRGWLEMVKVKVKVKLSLCFNCTPRHEGVLGECTIYLSQMIKFSFRNRGSSTKVPF